MRERLTLKAGNQTNMEGRESNSSAREYGMGMEALLSLSGPSVSRRRRQVYVYSRMGICVCYVRGV